MFRLNQKSNRVIMHSKIEILTDVIENLLHVGHFPEGYIDYARAAKSAVRRTKFRNRSANIIKIYSNEQAKKNDRKRW